MEYDQAFQNRAAQTAAAFHQAIPPIPAAMRSGHFPPEATVKLSTRVKNSNVTTFGRIRTLTITA